MVWSREQDIVDDSHLWSVICARPMEATLFPGYGNDARRLEEEGEAKEGADGHNKETSGPVSALAVCCYAGSGLVLGG